MTTQTELNRSQTVSIELGNFTEAVTNAVMRAVDSHRDRKKMPFPGTVTIGIIWEDDKSNFDASQQSSTKPLGLESSEMALLKTGQPLSKQSVGQLMDMLQSDYQRLRVRFAHSLGQDFGKSMDTLFELSSEERQAVYELSRDASDELRAMSHMLVAAFSLDYGLQLDLDISSFTTKQKMAEKKKVDMEFGFSAKCKTTKECETGVEFKIKF